MKPWHKKVALIILAIILFIACIKVFFPKNVFNETYCTVLLDRNNELLAVKIASDEQWRFPVQDTLPEKYKQCVLLFEDEYFYYHPGINPFSVLRAIYQNTTSGKTKSGASTISMQLARMALKNYSRSFWSKSKEALYTLFIEIAYSKSKILNLYAAHAPFGGNVVGLEAASWRYFGVSSEKLSWSQSATLAVLPNAPSLIFPGKNASLLIQKRNRLLKKLLTNQVIDSLTYQLALQEEIPTKPHIIPNYAPHLLAHLIKSGYEGQFTHTSLDASIQENAVNLAKIYGKKYQANKIHNLAILISEVNTGNVIAYVGNVPKLSNEDHGQDVDIIQSKRSTGSILKPFLFASCIQEAEILPTMLIEDVPSYFKGYTPKNFNNEFYGAVKAYQALARSLNVPSVLLLKEHGIEKFLLELQKLQLYSINQSADYYGLSLILGGAESTLWEICGAYASLSRTLNNYTLYNGKYNPNDIHPLRWLNKKNVPINKSELENYPKIYKASAIWSTYEALLKVNRPEEDLNWEMFSSSRKIAWKTGTSYGHRDAWAIATTPKYVVGVWAGNASGEGRSGLTGVNISAPIMFDCFDFLPLEHIWFTPPYDELEKISICSKSGYVFSENCEKSDSVLAPKECLEAKSCPYHQIIHLNHKGFRVSQDCELTENIFPVKWFVLPPYIEWFYKQKNINYTSLPPYKHNCNPLHSKSMAIIYPQHKSKIFIPKDFDQNKTNIVLEASHSNPNQKIFWHLNETYLGTTSGKHQISVKPEKGTYRLFLLDENGEELNIQFEITE